MKLKTSHHFQAGFSLIGVMVSAAVLAILALGFSTMLAQMSSQQTQSMIPIQVAIFRGNLLELISNQESWDNSVGKNASMSCLATGLACPAAGGNFLLYDAGDNLFYDGTGGTNGITPSGTAGAGVGLVNSAACQTFNGNPGQGNDQCPCQYILNWKPTCPAVGPCTGVTTVTVTANLKCNWGTSSRQNLLNPTPLGLSIPRNNL